MPQVKWQATDDKRHATGGKSQETRKEQAQCLSAMNNTQEAARDTWPTAVDQGIFERDEGQLTGSTRQQRRDKHSMPFGMQDRAASTRHVAMNILQVARGRRQVAKTRKEREATGYKRYATCENCTATCTSRQENTQQAINYRQHGTRVKRQATAQASGNT